MLQQYLTELQKINLLEREEELPDEQLPLERELLLLLGVQLRVDEELLRVLLPPE